FAQGVVQRCAEPTVVGRANEHGAGDHRVARAVPLQRCRVRQAEALGDPSSQCRGGELLVPVSHAYLLRVLTAGVLAARWIARGRSLLARDRAGIAAPLSYPSVG